MSLPALIVSEAVGYATSNDPKKTFNDLQAGEWLFGLWPGNLYIDKVAKITVHYGNTVINGIEIVYNMKNDSPQTIPHGLKIGTPKAYELQTDEYFVGFFGCVSDNPDKPVLNQLGFLIYNKTTGNLSNFGPFSDKVHFGTGVKGFTSLGLIAGFSGTESPNGALDTLAIYKFLPGNDSDFGISAGL